MTTHDDLLNELNQHREQLNQGGSAARLNDVIAPSETRLRLSVAEETWQHPTLRASLR